MKKAKINTRSLLKNAAAILLIGVYWFWINQKIISGSSQVFGLGGFFLLICVATAFFPLPANLLVLGAVQANEPWLVAMIAGFGTVVAYFSEHLFFTFLFKFNKVASFKNTWFYKQVGPLFDKSNFFILAFASFLPLPSEPLRIYAISRKYHKFLYMLSGFVGRFPRYFLLGYYGRGYVNSVWFLGSVFLFPVMLLLVLRGGVTVARWLKLKFKASTEEQGSIPVPVPSTASSFPDKDLEA
ncbi:MAG: hypothetical protein ACE5IR_07760 [bacterium]